jgi:hypothetical protein
MNYLPGLAWNCNSPDLSLPSSQDYRHELLVPGSSTSFSGYVFYDCLFEASRFFLYRGSLNSASLGEESTG